MDPPFLISSYFLEYILPFILVFTLIFAILEKTKLLGDDKKQVNAIMGLVVGLILIGTPFARDIVVKLMPFLAIFAVILLVFMLLYGFVEGKKEGDVLTPGLKIMFGVLLGISLAVAILFITGWWDKLFEAGSNGSMILINAIIVIAILVVVIVVIMGENGKKE